MCIYQNTVTTICAKVSELIRSGVIFTETMDYCGWKEKLNETVLEACFENLVLIAKTLRKPVNYGYSRHTSQQCPEIRRKVFVVRFRVCLQLEQYSSKLAIKLS